MGVGVRFVFVVALSATLSLQCLAGPANPGTGAPQECDYAEAQAPGLLSLELGDGGQNDEALLPLCPPSPVGCSVTEGGAPDPRCQPPTPPPPAAVYEIEGFTEAPVIQRASNPMEAHQKFLMEGNIHLVALNYAVATTSQERGKILVHWFTTVIGETDDNPQLNDARRHSATAVTVPHHLRPKYQVQPGPSKVRHVITKDISGNRCRKDLPANALLEYQLESYYLIGPPADRFNRVQLRPAWIHVTRAPTRINDTYRQEVFDWLMESSKCLTSTEPARLALATQRFHLIGIYEEINLVHEQTHHRHGKDYLVNYRKFFNHQFKTSKTVKVPAIGATDGVFDDEVASVHADVSKALKEKNLECDEQFHKAVMAKEWVLSDCITKGTTCATAFASPWIDSSGSPKTPPKFVPDRYPSNLPCDYDKAVDEMLSAKHPDWRR